MNALTDRNTLGLINEIDAIIAECPTINEGTQSKLRIRMLRLTHKVQETHKEAEHLISNLDAKLSKKTREYEVVSQLIALK